MAITAAMNTDEHESDGHEHDVVMPGFRFHPTEEELIEFYLRRKVEGKRFNVELISFLDLYSYDPWELPGKTFLTAALATIGEKEWYFYVPRDRKYRNGDRPNRVTTSGYWKATGADRMIRTENSRSIGLKKTLVFYSGKAPKGIRSSWIMNEYRLPQGETHRYQKGEISLCRVYKRSGVYDHYHHLPGTLSSRPSSSRTTGLEKKHNMDHQHSSSFRALQGDPSSSKIEKVYQLEGCNNTTVAPRSSTTSTKEDGAPLHPSINSGILVPTCNFLPSTSPSMVTATVDELGTLADYNQSYLHPPSQFLSLPSQSQLLSFNALPNSSQAISDKLWEWNPISEAGREYITFK